MEKSKTTYRISTSQFLFLVGLENRVYTKIVQQYQAIKNACLFADV